MIERVTQATWPPSRMIRVGPFDVPLDTEGGGRPTAVRRADGNAPVTAADIAAVHDAKPGAVFSVRDDDAALAAVLTESGHIATRHTAYRMGPLAPLLDPAPPPVSGWTHWPPLAAVRDLWVEDGIDAGRQAVMDRAPAPKAAILLRADDRVAGALFVAVARGVAMPHAVLTLPRVRRRGVGRTGMRHAARWAVEHGAEWMGLAVLRGNVAANALYQSLGLGEVGGYAYWRKDDG